MSRKYYEENYVSSDEFRQACKLRGWEYDDFEKTNINRCDYRTKGNTYTFKYKF